MKIISIFLLLNSFSAPTASDTTIVAKVNGLTITKTELQREMRRYRALVFNQYHRVSVATLKEKSLAAMVDIKVQEQLLEANKLWPYCNYNDLMQARININRQRRQTVQHHGVIYGPIEYTEDNFFDYQFSNAVIYLKKALNKSDKAYNLQVKRLVKKAFISVKQKALSAI